MFYGYTLVTIENMETPLAPAPHNAWASLVPWLIGAIILLILVILERATSYILECGKCKRQITYISETYKIPIKKVSRMNLKELISIREEMEHQVLMGFEQSYS